MAGTYTSTDVEAALGILTGGRETLTADAWRQSLGLDALETQHGLPAGLLTSVVQAESNGNPRAENVRSGARGLFQFMPRTAAAYKIDAYDPQQAAPAAAKELASLYTKYEGDLDKTLAGWNWGQGRVDKFGMGKMPKETQGFLAKVKGFLGPGTAEAATPGGTYTSADVEAALQALGGGQPVPVSTSDDAAATIAQMRQRQTPEPPSDLTIDIGTPSAAPAQVAPSGNPYLPPGVPSIEEETLEEGITKPSTMIPLLAGGAGVTAVKGLAGQQMLSRAATRGARAVGEGLSQTLGWTTGRTMETGQVPTPGEVGTEAAFAIGTGGVLEGLSAGVQTALRRSRAGRAIVAADTETQAAHAAWQQEVTTLNEAHAARVAATTAEQQAAKAEVYDTAMRRVATRQAQYQTKVKARDDLITANEQTYQEALTAHRGEVRGELAARYGQERETTMATQAASTRRRQDYQQAVRAQEGALAQAREVPGRYAPGTASWTLYEKFGDAAKDATVDLTPAKAALAELRASRGALLSGEVRPFPSAVESIASRLEQASGVGNVKAIRGELRALGPLTRSPNGDIRGPAKQLHHFYGDAMEASPATNDLLREANATFRKEMALQDVSEWLRPGHGVVRIDQQGRQTINVGTLLTKLEKEIGDSTLFAGAFAPAELQALRQDFGRLAGTPRMPTMAPPPSPTPTLLPGAMPDLPAGMQRPPVPKPLPPEVSRPAGELLPGGAGSGRRIRDVPEQAPLPAPPARVTPQEALGERPPWLGPRAGSWGAILATLQAFGMPTAPLAAAAAVQVTGRQGRWLLANALLDPKRRALMQAAMDGQQRVHPRVYGAILATLSGAEKAQYQRETRETRR